MEMDIVYEDDYILAAVKPPGMPSQPDKTGDGDFLSTLLARADKNCKNPYLAMITRLDRPVGGIMIFAKTQKAAGELSKVLAQGGFQKEYLAVLTGTLSPVSGELTDYLLKNGKTNLSAVVNQNRQGAKQAKLIYTIQEEKQTQQGLLSLAHIRLITGRHHQIRVQMANAKSGIWGDRKYNGQAMKAWGQTHTALWAYRITFQSPFHNQRVVVSQKPSEYPFTLFDSLEI